MRPEFTRGALPVRWRPSRLRKGPPLKPWITLGEATAPDGHKLLLQQRDTVFVVRAGGHVLMTSQTHGSEEAMATAALEPVKTAAPRVLIGGLGLGYTVRAVLDAAPPKVFVVVAELVAEVIAWNRGPAAHLAGNPLGDPRVEVLPQDVMKLIDETEGRFDAILLDVDNGPSALTHEKNARLYGFGGLAAIKRALRPHGRLVVWSASDDPAFVRRLTKAGFKAEVRHVPARKTGPAAHVLFIADASPGR